MGQIIYLSAIESDDKYSSIFEDLEKNQDTQKVKLNNTIFNCRGSKTDLESRRQTGFQGKVADNFELLEDGTLCIGTCS